jgi:hypothetical protein
MAPAPQAPGYAAPLGLSQADVAPLLDGIKGGSALPSRDIPTAPAAMTTDPQARSDAIPPSFGAPNMQLPDLRPPVAHPEWHDVLLLPAVAAVVVLALTVAPALTVMRARLPASLWHADGTPGAKLDILRALAVGAVVYAVQQAL